MTQSLARLIGGGRRPAAGALLAGLVLAGALVVAVPAEAAPSHHRGHAHAASKKPDPANKPDTLSKKHESAGHGAATAPDRAAEPKRSRLAKTKAATAHGRKHAAAKATQRRTAAKATQRRSAAKATQRRTAAKATQRRSAATAHGMAPAAIHPTKSVAIDASATKKATAGQVTADQLAVQPPRLVVAQSASWPLSGTDTTTAPVLTGVADQLTPVLSGAKAPAGPVKKAAGKVPAGKLKKAIQKPGQPVAGPTASNPVPTQKPPVPAPTATSGVSGSEPANSLAGTGTSPGQGGPAVVPARPAVPKPAQSSQPPQYRSASAASHPLQIVFALPHRIAQAGLSVGRVPLALLVIVMMAGLGLVVTGTRRRSSGEG